MSTTLIKSTTSKKLVFQKQTQKHFIRSKFCELPKAASLLRRNPTSELHVPSIPALRRAVVMLLMLQSVDAVIKVYVDTAAADQFPEEATVLGSELQEAKGYTKFGSSLLSDPINAEDHYKVEKNEMTAIRGKHLLTLAPDHTKDWGNDRRTAEAAIARKGGASEDAMTSDLRRMSMTPGATVYFPADKVPDAKQYTITGKRAWIKGIIKHAIKSETAGGDDFYIVSWPLGDSNVLGNLCRLNDPTDANNAVRTDILRKPMINVGQTTDKYRKWLVTKGKECIDEVGVDRITQEDILRAARAWRAEARSELVEEYFLPEGELTPTPEQEAMIRERVMENHPQSDTPQREASWGDCIFGTSVVDTARSIQQTFVDNVLHRRRRVMERLLRYENHYSSGAEGHPPKDPSYSA